MKHYITSILFHWSSYRLEDHGAAAGWLWPPSSTTPREATPPSIQLHASSVWLRRGKGLVGWLSARPRPPQSGSLGLLLRCAKRPPQAAERPVEPAATALRFLFVSLGNRKHTQTLARVPSVFCINLQLMRYLRATPPFFFFLLFSLLQRRLFRRDVMT